MFEFRRFKDSDLDGAVKVWKDCNREAKSFLWGKPSIEVFADAYVLIDTDRDLVVGYVSLKPAHKSESIRLAEYDALHANELLLEINNNKEYKYIRQIGLLCNYQEKGLGTKMLSAILNKESTVYYSLIRLFKKFGFYEIGYYLCRDYGNASYEIGLDLMPQNYLWRVVKGIRLFPEVDSDSEFKVNFQ